MVEHLPWLGFVIYVMIIVSVLLSVRRSVDSGINEFVMHKLNRNAYNENKIIWIQKDGS